MSQTLSQLALGISLKDEATFANFYPGQNVELVATLKQMASGQGERVIYLCGTRGEGGTHLLQACCHLAAQNCLTSFYLPLAEFVTLSPAILDGLETFDLVCIDDLHLVCGYPQWEEAIFHFYNRVYDQGGRLAFVAQALPKALALTLPDLVSRLAWGVVYQLQPLADQEKLSALIMRAGRRGITLSQEVGKYLLTHCPRHMGTLCTALDALDKASLAAQRRLTIPFVKEVLQI